MSNFQNLTPINGFDFSNLNNARQNNYAWSMSELGDFIYVGTGRNIIYNIIKAIEPRTQIPALINPDPLVNRAEIWRYRKDGSLPWERVYQAPADSGIVGFRFMIKHQPFGGSPCLYAAGLGERVQILKTTNGVNWFILPDTVLQGNSSRSMVVHKGKIYIATAYEVSENSTPFLYSSVDPEFYPWEPVIDSSAPGFDPSKNPQGSIYNIAVFNNRIYVATNNETGVQIWRTNKEEPRLNDWTLVVDKGFGNPANRYSLAMGVFKNHLYVSGTKPLPLSWFIPMGCDIVRIDKNDNWRVVVGGNPLIPLNSAEGQKQNIIPEIGSGFNNPFNVYAWQIQEYKGRLFVSTFDDSSNMEVILTTLLANRAALEQLIGPVITRLLIEIYESVVEILRAIKYPQGFDLYMSEDGIHFYSVFMGGLNNPHNYGGRILFVDSKNDLYIGTANPFQGCEVWRVSEINRRDLCPCDENHYKNLWDIKEIIQEKYHILSENIPTVLKSLPKNMGVLQPVQIV
jgi:hypothetical protein